MPIIICPKTRRPIIRPATSQAKGTRLITCFSCPFCHETHWTEEVVGVTVRKIVKQERLSVCQDLTEEEVLNLPKE